MEKILYSSYHSLITFGKVFLGGDFKKSETPIFHYELAEKFEEKTQRPAGIFLPRGHAKTVYVKAKIMHDFLFSKKAFEWGFAKEEKTYFYAWVSSSQRKSINNIRYIRLHLTQNGIIRYFYGDDALRLAIDNQEEIMMTNGNRIVSSSNLTSIRGDTQATIKDGSLRYSGVFCDDSENEENTRSEGGRAKIVDNIMNGILPAIDKNDPSARLFFIQTPVHFASFAAHIMYGWEQLVNTPFKQWIPEEHRPEPTKEMEEYPWSVICYQASQENLPGGVLWQSWMDREKLDAEKRRYEASPRGVAGYYQEYELEVQSEETARWTKAHIRYHDMKYIWKDGQSYVFDGELMIPVNTFIGCDPATDIDTLRSDFSVVMVIAIDMHGNVYVLDYWRKRDARDAGIRDANFELIGNRGTVDVLFEKSEEYHTLNGTIEDVAMNRSVFQQIADYKFRTNKHNVIFIPHPPGGHQKHTRIYSGLNHRFTNRTVHIRKHMYDLFREITTFGPTMKHDDTIETLYYACLNSRPYKGKATPLQGERKKLRKKRKKVWYLA